LFVFLPEPLELFDHLVIPADPLVDRVQDRVDREDGPEQDANQFGFHDGVPQSVYREQETGIFPALFAGFLSDVLLTGYIRTGVGRPGGSAPAARAPPQGDCAVVPDLGNFDQSG
jgi:hypothetical protein